MDDSNVFLKNQEPVTNVLAFFQTLHKATGITINLEKTTVTLINTNETTQIQNMLQKLQLKNNMKQLKF